VFADQDWQIKYAALDTRCNRIIVNARIQMSDNSSSQLKAPNPSQRVKKSKVSKLQPPVSDVMSNSEPIVSDSGAASTDNQMEIAAMSELAADVLPVVETTPEKSVRETDQPLNLSTFKRYRFCLFEIQLILMTI
jgi:TPP-dependent trihydroxycyclohexane-1,2-dione (THcHDO) dehydratase